MTARIVTDFSRNFVGMADAQLRRSQLQEKMPLTGDGYGGCDGYG